MFAVPKYLKIYVQSCKYIKDRNKAELISSSFECKSFGYFGEYGKGSAHIVILRVEEKCQSTQMLVKQGIIVPVCLTTTRKGKSINASFLQKAKSVILLTTTQVVAILHTVLNWCATVLCVAVISDRVLSLFGTKRSLHSLYVAKSVS